MKLKAGNLVLIDLQMAQTLYSTASFRCCGRRYNQDDLHTLLHCVAEGEWRVTSWPLHVCTCPYCGHHAPRGRGTISLEVSSPFLIGGVSYHYLATPRAWLRLAVGGS